jgi:hypothetical protein
MALSIEGILPDQPGARAQIVLNGALLGELDKAGSFSKSFPLSNGLLGSSAWGDLAVSVDRVFNPRALGRSSDCRDLGVMITGLRLRDLGLPAGGVVDLGAPEARGHLGSGWSQDEKWGDRTMVWADAPESTVWWSLPRAADFLVTVTLRPFAFPSAPPQSVRVLVNGKFVVEIAVAGDAWRSHSFRLPRSLLAPGVNTLRFVYGYVASPSKVLPGNPDHRTLAVAMDSIEFREER